MRRLASPIDQIQSHYSVVVVGSGYGGSIAASRFARAGRDVCLLERGNERLPGEYPDTLAEVARESQFDLPGACVGSETGLLDFRVNPDINVLVGCGLGGTSLINAGVAVTPDERVFDDPRWPVALRQDRGTRFEEGLARAREMLRPSTYPPHFPKLDKIKALEKSSTEVSGTEFRPLPINVTFESRVNEAGVRQEACIGCGDCVTGCNHTSKNTTLMNYLPDARNHGAEIFTSVKVRHLERKNGRWLVHYQIAGAGREKFDSPTMFVSADLVVLAAGALGSTEILLRSKARGLAASPQLGRRFTGNGDALGFSYNSDVAINGVGFGPNSAEGRNPVGPCITSVLDGRGTARLEDGFVIEEGSLPGAIGDVVRVPFAQAAALTGKDTDMDVADAVRERMQELESLVCGPHAGAMARTQTYLVMAHDDGEGRMRLDDDRLRINWPGVGSQPVFAKVNEKLLEATRPLGGTFMPNPTWNPLLNHQLMTVHPLGGCVMAERAEDGVVNDRGQVFSGTAGSEVYPDLIVCDGSIVPRPLGINPLLTISALAERSVALVAQERGWTIDYTIRPVAPAPEAALPAGIRFTETMKGHFSTSEKADFKKGAARGQQDGSSFRFILTITAEDANRMMTGADRESRAVGTVEAPALSTKPLTVRDGIFQLLVEDPTRVETRNMIYRLPMVSEEGKTFTMHGVKLVHSDKGMLDLWDDTTTLYITVHEGDGTDGPVVGKGILHIALEDFAVQMQTLEVFRARDRREQMEITARFGQLFAGALFDVYGPVAARPNRIDPTRPPARKKRPLRMKPPEVHPVETSDGTEIRLTRYAGGKKGPVILSPGFGVSTLSFSIDTIETNLPEYLYAYGYDVWLLDYRASPDLPSSATLFTLDDIARRDYPAAVARVREVTGAPSVQVLAHCIGSMTFLMAMMSGLEGVRSAVCSQLGLFPITSTANQVKSGLGAGHFLVALGETTLDTNLPPSDWRNTLARAVVEMGPPEEMCSSSVCHQVRTIFGESYAHDQLNQATHAALHEMFGVTNLKTFNHISTTIRKGHVVDSEGRDVYMPHVDRLHIPIAFVQGGRNQLFFPEGTRKTFRHLTEKNGADNYIHLQFPNYAHMDLFVGKNAVSDVYEHLRLELDKFPA